MKWQGKFSNFHQGLRVTEMLFQPTIKSTFGVAAFPIRKGEKWAKFLVILQKSFSYLFFICVCVWFGGVGWFGVGFQNEICRRGKSLQNRFSTDLYKRVLK